MMIGIFSPVLPAENKEEKEQQYYGISIETWGGRQRKICKSRMTKGSTRRYCKKKDIFMSPALIVAICINHVFKKYSYTKLKWIRRMNSKSTLHYIMIFPDHLIILCSLFFCVFLGPVNFRLGNKAFAAQDYNEAIRCYTEAIKLDSHNHIYFSNRRYVILLNYPTGCYFLCFNSFRS